jgi:hypothetical protein
MCSSIVCKYLVKLRWTKCWFLTPWGLIVAAIFWCSLVIQMRGLCIKKCIGRKSFSELLNWYTRKLCHTGFWHSVNYLQLINSENINIYLKNSIYFIITGITNTFNMYRYIKRIWFCLLSSEAILNCRHEDMVWE